MSLSLPVTGLVPNHCQKGETGRWTKGETEFQDVPGCVESQRAGWQCPPKSTGMTPGLRTGSYWHAACPEPDPGRCSKREV